MRHNDRFIRAFTLIELLAVIAIIGILVALSVGPLSSARQRGRDAQRKADLHIIAQALDLYYADNRQYPLAGAAGTNCIAKSTTINSSNPNASWVPGLESYMTASANKLTPRDPQNTATYRYEYYAKNCLTNVPGGFTTTDGISYVLVAYLENKNDIEGKQVDANRVYRVVR